MTFEFYSIFDIINNLDNDLTIIRSYYDKTSDNTDDLNKYFICAEINLVGYNKMLFNKYIKNKDDKKLIETYEKQILYNKSDFVFNCYEVDFK